jgi:hypothetical protein
MRAARERMMAPHQLPPSLSPGSVLEGTVTQIGTLKEGNYQYEALQRCKIRINEVDGSRVMCEIHRKEMFKQVNGHSLEDHDAVRALPSNLQRYLQSKGSCVEHAQGVFDPFTRILTLKGQWPQADRLSGDVVWSPHLYTLMAMDKSISGAVFCLDRMPDRESGLGSLLVMSNDK